MADSEDLVLVKETFTSSNGPVWAVSGNYRAEVVLDSVGVNGCRLTTLQVTFPRFVLAEFNTHRMFTRSSASSRAIPVKKRIKEVWSNPFVPEAFSKNKAGMQADTNIDGWQSKVARFSWLALAKLSCVFAWIFSKLGMHKQHANRVLEPFSWHTVIVTATDWDNFLALRCHPDAQPEIRIAAELMRDAMAHSTPQQLKVGDWHLPFVNGVLDSELSIDDKIKVSCARCARVSYLTHDGRRDVSADIKLYDRLLSSAHMSPLEHAARSMANPARYGNFKGWKQHRKYIPGEAVFSNI